MPKLIEYKYSCFSCEHKTNDKEDNCGCHSMLVNNEEIEEQGYTKEQYADMVDPPYRTNALGKIKWNEFVRAIKEKDFSEGDILFLNGVQFECTGVIW